MPGQSAELGNWCLPKDIARICNIPLPASRYFPGLNERPRKMEIPPRDAFVYGLDLYNHACWWEAHEAWEDAWFSLTPQSLEKLGVELLINAANLNLKITLQKRNAAERLAAGIEEKFDEWNQRGGTQVLGVEVPQWYHRYRTYIGITLDPIKLLHSPEIFPFLQLSLNSKK